MTKGFAPPRPWQCRIYQGQRIFASLKIGTVDGTTITRSNALKTAKRVTALCRAMYTIRLCLRRGANSKGGTK